MTISLLKSGADKDLIATVLETHRAEMAEAKRLAYFEALRQFQAKGITVAKTERRQFTAESGEEVDYRYAPLPEVTAAVSPALTEVGLTYDWRILEQTADFIRVACRLTHKDGHTEEVALGAPPDESGDKTRGQQVTSTVTLLERATLKAITGVAERADDTDGRLTSRSTRTAKAEATPAPEADRKFMSPGDFDAQLPNYQRLIESGMRSADDIDVMTRTRGITFSPEQIKRLKEIETDALTPA